MKTPKITFHILTLFPEIFGQLSHSILKRAEKKGLIKVKSYNLRKWGIGKRKQVDDKAYGGGAGMVLKVEVIDKALKEIKKKINPIKSRRAKGTASVASERPASNGVKTILLTPQGKKFNQKMARKLSEEKNIILLCGHYEGFDERIRKLADEEISVGDYVLSGGEFPAMILVDAISRLIPGVLGKEESLKEESFENGMLEYPQYTMPREYKGQKVPKVLLSGDHKKITEWRKDQAIKKTKKNRPDLLNGK